MKFGKAAAGVALGLALALPLAQSLPWPSLDPALCGSSGLQVGANKALIDCPEGRAPLRLLPSVPPGICREARG